MFGISNKNTGKTISVDDIDKLIGEIDLIDIREPYEYSSGSIKSAKNIPMQTLLNNPDKYLKNRDGKVTLIVYSEEHEKLIKEYDISSIRKIL